MTSIQLSCRHCQVLSGPPDRCRPHHWPRWNRSGRRCDKPNEAWVRGGSRLSVVRGGLWRAHAGRHRVSSDGIDTVAHEHACSHSDSGARSDASSREAECPRWSRSAQRAADARCDVRQRDGGRSLHVRLGVEAPLRHGCAVSRGLRRVRHSLPRAVRNIRARPPDSPRAGRRQCQPKPVARTRCSRAWIPSEGRLGEHAPRPRLRGEPRLGRGATCHRVELVCGLCQVCRRMRLAVVPRKGLEPAGVSVGVNARWHPPRDASMGDLLDIRRLLDGRSLEVADQYPKGLYCLALAVAKHAEIDGDQPTRLADRGGSGRRQHRRRHHSNARLSSRSITPLPLYGFVTGSALQTPGCGATMGFHVETHSVTAATSSAAAISPCGGCHIPLWRRRRRRHPHRSLRR